LRQHAILALVDVRSVPYSQYTPQFNREPFERLLRVEGIEYRFAGDFLGGRPKDPALYKHGEYPAEHANYLKLVDYALVAESELYQRGLAGLIRIAGKRRTTIMCSEEDPRDCHRHHLITPTLIERGIRVLHLRGSGEVEIAPRRPLVRQPDLFGEETL
jgi:uncharacterized protein (DUF488 family)